MFAINLLNTTDSLYYLLTSSTVLKVFDLDMLVWLDLSHPSADCDVF